MCAYDTGVYRVCYGVQYYLIVYITNVKKYVWTNELHVVLK